MANATTLEEGKQNMQDRILNAAEELFASSSYSATRISDIAAKAGVNQALVHYYFSTKERLYEAVLERLFQQWESYLLKQSWEDVRPEHMLQQYIEAHFEIKCQVPNLYKIFHKESIDGGEMFSKYASKQWLNDYKDKSEMFKRWKLAGIIEPQANEQVVLFCLWGMMNQFYYRDLQALQMITGLTGTKEELQREIVEQMVALAKHGILTHTKRNQVEAVDGQLKRIQLLVFPSDLDPLKDEVEHMEEVLRDWKECELQLVASDADMIEALEQISTSHLTFIITSTQVGELSPALLSWLQLVEQQHAAIVERYVGIWTKKGTAAADALQRQLEETVNRLGGFSVARTPTLTLHGYLNRCAKMSRL
ncbi:TetR/AcrR family transcriptional regulator [Paenibacillus septentrionalis]|uniref:TetR/AcrR family transcriptional regulator n=1 Tax=Paenibacillus septentrionalis TaxID=429342 RepID=A0ABW1V602_9BACL